MEKYKELELIGNGSFGQVYRVLQTEEKKEYVCKRIKTKDLNEKDRKNIENEVAVLQKLRHPNIVAYKDSFLDSENNLNIIMSYCEGGDMYNRIKEAESTHFQESVLFIVMIACLGVVCTACAQFALYASS